MWNRKKGNNACLFLAITSSKNPGQHRVEDSAAALIPRMILKIHDFSNKILDKTKTGI
jgi:hypothetical protein